MKRLLLVLIGAGLVLVPAAAAKGPHAIFTTPREPVEAGKPWQFTVELNEFPRAPHPAIVGRNGARTVGARMQRTPSSIIGATAFRATMVFPRDGRWRLRMFAERRRFALPPIDVGGASAPQNWVAFPIGSEAAQAGGGGPLITDEQRTVPAVRSESRDEGGGMGAWVLPLLGVAVAGAGVAAVRRRGGWRPPRRRSAQPRPPSRD